MRLIGIMPARNEQWVIGLTARAALLWMDGLVVLNHCSTDRTTELLSAICYEHPGRVVVLTDADPTWYEMRHRQWLLDTAREFGATHVALVDADEILTGNLLSEIRGHIERAPKGEVAQLAWLCMWRGLDRVCVKSKHWASAWVSFAFEDRVDFHWAQRGGYDFHHRHPIGSVYAQYRPVPRARGGLMHLQFAQWRRLLGKQALYKMTEVVRWPGRETLQAINHKYDAATNELDIVCSGAPQEWWSAYETLMPYVDVNDPPWQIEQCRKLMGALGPEKFKGLNLYGVCE